MAHSPGPPAERAANGYFFTPHGRAVAPANGAFLPRLLGRQGSGGFLPLWGGPPARFGDFPAVESHAGVGLRPQARFEANRRRRLLGRDVAAPQSYPQARSGVSRFQAVRFMFLVFI